MKVQAAAILGVFGNRDRLVALAPRLVTSALAGAIVLQGSYTARDLFWSASSAVAGQPTRTIPVQDLTVPTVDIAALIAAHLFGESPRSAADPSAQPVETALSLVLTGVIAAKNPRKGSAILGESATAARLFQVDAVVPGGARLHEVYADRVLLEHDGAIEVLLLPRQRLTELT